MIIMKKKVLKANPETSLSVLAITSAARKTFFTSCTSYVERELAGIAGICYTKIEANESKGLI